MVVVVVVVVDGVVVQRRHGEIMIFRYRIPVLRLCYLVKG